MGSAADGHILYWSCRDFLGINHFQLTDATFLQFAAHNLGKRADLSLINVRNFKLACIQFVSGAHRTDDRNPFLLRLHDKGDFCSNGIYCIYNIIIFFKWKIVCILRQKKTLMCLHLHVRIDFQHTLFHNIRLVFSHCFSCCNDLAVQIRKAYLVVVDQVKSTYPASHQRLTHISANTANSKYCHPGTGKFLHPLFSKKKLGS